MQVTAPAVHCPPPPPPMQQVWPPPPHVPQLPLVHVPPMLGHADPELTHRAFTQQPPLQSPAAQHVWPAPPHWAHTPPPPPPPPPLQAKPAEQLRPGQHVCPAAPHCAQTPALHAAPPWQVPPVQQAAPGAPQELPSVDASPSSPSEELDPAPPQASRSPRTIAASTRMDVVMVQAPCPRAPSLPGGSNPMD